MRGVNSTVAKYCEELKKAEAVPRSLVGNQAAVMRALAGKTGASARPTQRRSVNSTATAEKPVKKPTAPCRSVKADHRKIAPA
ncbi:hypothetical protein AEGHOMDF_4855 [Methylobacterium soli]|nr:hypothetical protein AEGHOMDF_4855 [Methylobacterium soli]